LRKTLVIPVSALLLVGIALSVYYNSVYLPEKRLEERIRPLIDADLTREEAIAFDRTHQHWATNNRYNATSVTYAVGLRNHPLSTRSLLNTTKSVDRTALSLDSLATSIRNGTLTDEGMSKYVLDYPSISADGITTEEVPFFVHLKNYPLTTEALYEITKSLPFTLQSITSLGTLLNGTTDERASQFALKCPQLVIDDGWNATDAKLFGHYLRIPELTSSIIKSISAQLRRLDVLSTLLSVYSQSTLENRVTQFIEKHPEYVSDGQLNATDRETIDYYLVAPGVVDKVIGKVKAFDRLYVLEETIPYLNNPLTEEQAHQLVERWYPDLFEACMKKRVPVVLGDVDEDGLDNHREVSTYRTNPLDPDTDDDENTDYEETLGWVKELGEKTNPGYVDPLRWSPLFVMKESEAVEKDFIVYCLGKTAVHESAKYNRGVITGIHKLGSNTSLVGLGGGFYHNLILGYLDQEGRWNVSNGRILESFNISKPWGKYVEWRESHLDDQLGFRTSSTNRVHLANNKYLSIDVNASFEVLSDIPNVVGLWIEHGWNVNKYRYAAIKNINGKVIIKDLTKTPGIHYFTDQLITKDGWIVAYRSDEFDASVTLKFRKGYPIILDGVVLDNKVMPATWDGPPEGPDTIELHVVGAPWDNPSKLRKGENYKLSYTMYISNGEQYYLWIDTLP